MINAKKKNLKNYDRPRDRTQRSSAPATFQWEERWYCKNARSVSEMSAIHTKHSFAPINIYFRLVMVTGSMTCRYLHRKHPFSRHIVYHTSSGNRIYRVLVHSRVGVQSSDCRGIKNGEDWGASQKTCPELSRRNRSSTVAIEQSVKLEVYGTLDP